MLLKKSLVQILMSIVAMTLCLSLNAADAKTVETQPSAKTDKILHIPIETDQTDVYAIPYDSSEEEEDILLQDYENEYNAKHHKAAAPAK